MLWIIFHIWAVVPVPIFYTNYIQFPFCTSRLLFRSHSAEKSRTILARCPRHGMLKKPYNGIMIFLIEGWIFLFDCCLGLVMWSSRRPFQSFILSFLHCCLWSCLQKDTHQRMTSFWKDRGNSRQYHHPWTDMLHWCLTQRLKYSTNT